MGPGEVRGFSTLFVSDQVDDDLTGRKQSTGRVPGAWTIAVGFALMLSFSTMQSLVGVRLPGSLGGGHTALVVERLLEVATFLAIALAASRLRLRDLGARRGLAWGCAVACSLDVLVECLAIAAAGGTAWIVGAADGLAIAAHLTRCVVGGVAPCVLWMCWIELYARLDMRRVTLHYLLANVLQAVLCVVLGLAPTSPAALGVTLVLPLASCALFYGARRAVGLPAGEPDAALGDAPGAGGARGAGGAGASGPSGQAPAPARAAFPAAPVVLMAAFTLANVFARDVLPAEDRGWATVGIVACLAMLLVVLRRGSLSFGVWPLCGIAFPLTMAGLFGLLVDGPAWGVAATLCTHAGDTLFAVFIGVVLCNVAFRYGASALYLFGLAKAAGSAAALAGALLAFSCDDWGAGAFTLLVAGIALVLCASYVSLTWRPTGEITWGAQPAAEVRGARAEVPDAARAELLARCSRAAYEYGLTRREEEVLALLAQGMTAQQIEGALCVSNSTVKSHTHAVYQKMGLHSRAELIERMRPENG